MSDIDTLTIGQAREAIQRGKELETLMTGRSPLKPASSPVNYTAPQIVILDRGFVFVGDVAIDGDWLVIRNAKNIRRWGTTKGLGELANEGPKAETKIDHAGTVRAPMRSVVGLLECEASSWIKQ